MSYSGINKNVFSKLPKQEVELSAEKVELGLADNANKISSDVRKSMNNVDKELDSAFTPIRQLESVIERLTSEIPTNIESFKAFKTELMKLESEYSKAIDKLRNAESELGVKIPFPKDLAKISKDLEEYQRKEEIFRTEISEFNKLSKKYKAI